VVEHCATSRKVAGSIHNEIIDVFNLPDPFSLTVALGLTQPLTEMSTRNLRVGKARQEHNPDNLTSSTSRNPYRPLRPVTILICI
jgi:hypothetical protein